MFNYTHSAEICCSKPDPACAHSRAAPGDAADGKLQEGARGSQVGALPGPTATLQDSHCVGKRLAKTCAGILRASPAAFALKEPQLCSHWPGTAKTASAASPFLL